LPASHLALATASVQNGGRRPVRRARVQVCAGASRPARGHGYQADESQRQSPKTCHGGQESTLRAQRFPLSLRGKRHSVCAAPCRTLIDGSASRGVR
jgi:hypothetical protein